MTVSPYAWDLAGSLPATVADWEAIEDAIQAQIVTGSGLEPSSVIWSHQSADRPDRNFIMLEHTHSSFASPATPELRQSDTPGAVIEDPGVPGAGDEVTLSALDTLDFSIRLHFFGVDSTGPGSARARLSAVRGFLGTERVTDALDASGVALVECGPVQPLPVILETKFESRATLDVQFRTVDGFEEQVTFIQTIKLGTRIPKSDGTDTDPAVTITEIVQP